MPVDAGNPALCETLEKVSHHLRRETLWLLSEIAVAVGLDTGAESHKEAKSGASWMPWGARATYTVCDNKGEGS